MSGTGSDQRRGLFARLAAWVGESTVRRWIVALVVVALVAGCGLGVWWARGSGENQVEDLAASLGATPGVEKVEIDGADRDGPQTLAVRTANDLRAPDLKDLVERLDRLTESSGVEGLTLQVGSASATVAVGEGFGGATLSYLLALRSLPRMTVEVDDLGSSVFLRGSAPRTGPVEAASALLGALERTDISTDPERVAVEIETMAPKSDESPRSADGLLRTVVIEPDDDEELSWSVLGQRVEALKSQAKHVVAIEFRRGLLLKTPAREASRIEDLVRAGQSALSVAPPLDQQVTVQHAETYDSISAWVGDDPAAGLKVREQLGRAGIEIDAIDADLSTLDVSTAGSLRALAEKLDSVRPELGEDASVRVTHTPGSVDAEDRDAGSPGRVLELGLRIGDLVRSGNALDALRRKGYDVTWKESRRGNSSATHTIVVALPPGQVLSDAGLAQAATDVRTLRWGGVAELTLQDGPDPTATETQSIRQFLSFLSTATGRTGEVQIPKRPATAQPDATADDVEKAWNKTATSDDSTSYPKP